MARRARRSQPRELSTHMATRARCRDMFAGQRELGRVVVEDRSRPLRRRVARFACLREPCRGVIRILSRLEFRQVTSRASRPESGELSTHMATRARCRGMFARQRELGRIVIEDRARPLRCRMARFARLRESGRYVIRIRGLLEFR